MTSARSYFFALVIAAAMASRNIAAHEGSPSFPQRDSGPPTASLPSALCASTLDALGTPHKIRAALIEGMVKLFRDSQIDSDRLREFLRDPLAAQINWNSGADLNSHAQAITLFQTFARDLQPAEQSQLIIELTAALQAILAEREASRIIARESLDRTKEIPLFIEFDTGSSINSVAISPDGRHILTGSSDGIARLWDIATAKEIQRYHVRSRFDSSISSVAFSPNGTQIVTGCWDMTARLWDSQTGKQLQRFQGHNEWISDVAFSPDGKFILTSSWDETARLWHVDNEIKCRRLKGHLNAVTSVAFSPDGNYLLTGSLDFTARLWNTNGQEINRFSSPGARVSVVAFSPNGKFVFTGFEEGDGMIWDIRTSKEVCTLKGHSKEINSAAFSPDSRYIITSSDDHTERLWDSKTGAELLQFEEHANAVKSVAFSPDGRHILTGSWDGIARLWPLSPQFWPSKLPQVQAPTPSEEFLMHPSSDNMRILLTLQKWIRKIFIR